MKRASLAGLVAVALGVAACGSVSSGASDAGVAGAGGGGASGGTGGPGGIGRFAGRVPANHRAAAIACPTDQPAGSCNATDPSIPDGGLMCRTDADCTAGAKGRCVGTGTAGATAAPRGPALPGCSCAYDACTTDSACTTGGPCACRPSGQGIVAPSPAATNVCLEGNCRVDADCGAGGYCSPSFGSCGAFGGVVGYYCHTPHDTCVDDGDCQVRGGTGDCRYSPASNAWACSTTQCVG